MLCCSIILKIAWNQWGISRKLLVSSGQLKIHLRGGKWPAPWFLVANFIKPIERNFVVLTLKLYCRYLYTRSCMINHIWGLKQLWLQVNGHAWFHLQRLRWPVRNGEGAKNSKWKYMSPAGFEPTPRQSMTGKLQRLRPLGHEGLMVITG